MIYVSFIGKNSDNIWSMYRKGNYIMSEFFLEHNDQLYKFNLPNENTELPQQSHVIVSCYNSQEECKKFSTYCRDLNVKCVFIFVNFTKIDLEMTLILNGPPKYIHLESAKIYKNKHDPLKLFDMKICLEDVYRKEAPLEQQRRTPSIDISPIIAQIMRSQELRNERIQEHERRMQEIIDRRANMIVEEPIVQYLRKRFSKYSVLDFLSKQQYETLAKPIKCPVCLEEILYENFVLSPCGHYHCVSCVVNLDKCSVCRWCG